MLLRIVSDLHLEFSPLDLPVLATDKDTILILAGDIGNVGRDEATTVAHISKWANQFKNVIYVLGNHDFYYSDFRTTVLDVKASLESFSNVVVLDKETFELDNVCFIGATLWTDFKNGDATSMNFCQYAMADYKYINKEDGRVTPQDTLREHQHAKMVIFEKAKQAVDGGKKAVVITHHLPSYRSVHPFYAGSELNCAFATNLDNDIEHSDIALWIHGHTHYCFDYHIDSTRIFCNPRGYVVGNRIENHNFNPNAIIDLGE